MSPAAVHPRAQAEHLKGISGSLVESRLCSEKINWQSCREFATNLLHIHGTRCNGPGVTWCTDTNTTVHCNNDINDVRIPNQYNHSAVNQVTSRAGAFRSTIFSTRASTSSCFKYLNNWTSKEASTALACIVLLRTKMRHRKDRISIRSYGRPWPCSGEPRPSPAARIPAASTTAS